MRINFLRRSTSWLNRRKPEVGRARRRKEIVSPARLLLAAALLSPIAAIPVLTGAADLQAVAAALADPASLFSKRSPGPRVAGALAQSKPRLLPRPDALLSELPARKLRPAPRSAQAVPGADTTYQPLDLGEFEEGDILEGAPFVDVDAASTGSGFGQPSGFNGGGTLIGGGGFGGDNSLPSPVPELVPTRPEDPVSAVPEPGTWLMMILGFFLLGGALRRGNAPRGFRTTPCLADGAQTPEADRGEIS